MKRKIDTWYAMQWLISTSNLKDYNYDATNGQ